jgi:hypothetical protein
MQRRDIPEEFLVAFSFAGEQRDLVRSIAEAVERQLGHGTVFYDDWFEHYIAGDDADIRLKNIYGKRSILVIPCVSERYGGKPWTRAEHRAIRALQMQLPQSTEEKGSLRILPLRVGDGDVEGLDFTTICPDVRNRPIESTAELIINRLRLIRPESERSLGPSAAQNSPRRIYLAECTADLEDTSKPINRHRMKAFLEELGWIVLPSGEYPVDEYQSRLEADLKECLAFVQLLGRYPWKRGAFDHIQNDAAAALGKKRFRYRSSEIDLATVEQTHREFISAPGVIVTGFEDFKAHLKKELAVLAQSRERVEGTAGDTDNPPLIRVVIRSADPDVLWEKVFLWIYEQEKILPEQLGVGETIEAKQRGVPCHGFLVVCDAAALEEGPLSTRDIMEQCRLVQMSEKNSARRPPVGLVYWPPPAPSWAKLLRSTPLKLHRILGDAPVNLGDFFAEVRRVAQ